MDYRDTAQVGSLDVTTTMSLNGGPDPNDRTINTQVLFVVESFSQQQRTVPAPARSALQLLGLAALAGGRRRGAPAPGRSPVVA